MQTLSTPKHDSWLLWFLRGLLIAAVLVLFTRLLDLQVIRGKYFRTISNENRLRRIPISAPRGKILSREGNILVDNKMVKKAIVFDPVIGYVKTTVQNASNEESTINEWTRHYPMGADFAHVSGYLGEATPDEVGKTMPKCVDKSEVKLGDEIGRGGLEQQYECDLRGVDGEELIEVDAMGRKVRTLGRKEPIPGMDLTTTISFGLQKKASEIMRGKDGAVVVTNADGQVLALFSAPSFDPNLFVDQSKTKEVSTILADDKSPMFNRAIGGRFHPGSVFKPVVAISALEEGVIDENFRFDDPGVISIKSIYGNYTYNNWYFTQYGGKEGTIGLTRAIARSTDTFFYKVGEMTGVDNLDKWADIFALDKTTGVDLPGEVAGLIPSPEWKLRTKKERWFLGNTYNMSIGQGDVALTPIEVNRETSVVASNGYLCRPQIVQGQNCIKLNISDKSISLVRDGMTQACSPGGTGYPLFNYKVSVACKTGTAETEEANKTHAWFSAFAPADNPEIVATVLVEKGGEGSAVAAPLVKDLFDEYFTNRN